MSASRRWMIWSVYVVAWTTFLIFPVPEGVSRAADDIFVGRRYVVTKTLHIVSYAGLAILSGWLRAPVRFRIVLIAFIMAHAVGTELIQRTTGRSGTLDDVGFDHVGVFLGLALSWKWWRELSPPP